MLNKAPAPAELAVPLPVPRVTMRDVAVAAEGDDDLVTAPAAAHAE